uniref:Uncharacterized protein n=1 Tax=Oryza meridionalis TaxID=40149 RepID=A0A0E0CQ52_9ORYZ
MEEVAEGRVPLGDAAVADSARRGRISPPPVVAASLSLSLSRGKWWRRPRMRRREGADGQQQAGRGRAVAAPPLASLSLSLSPFRRSSPSTLPAPDPLFPPLFPASGRRCPLRRRRLQLWLRVEREYGCGERCPQATTCTTRLLTWFLCQKSPRDASPGRKRAARPCRRRPAACLSLSFPFSLPSLITVHLAGTGSALSPSLPRIRSSLSTSPTPPPALAKGGKGIRVWRAVSTSNDVHNAAPHLVPLPKVTEGRVPWEKTRVSLGARLGCKN